MEYKKIENDNYNFHFIKNENFKIVNVVVFFTKQFNKKDIKFGKLLTSNMVYTTKKYNTKNKIAIKGEELYGSRVSSGFSINGNCIEISFGLDFLNPKYVDNMNYEEQLDFLCEVLFNPNVSDNSFNKEFFDIIKSDIEVSINSIKDNPNRFAYNEFAKLMYKDTVGEYSTLPELSELNKVTPSNLYDYYKTLFDGSFNIDVVVFGDIEEDIVPIVKNKLSILKSGNKKLNFDVKYKLSNKIIEKIDNLKFNQSKLYIGYRLNNCNYHELRHVMKVYNTILGTMNDSILFNIVREENSLCYSIGSYTTRFNPSLVIYAGINKDNYEKARDLIIKCVESMKDRKTVEKLFDYAKKTINTYVNNYYTDINGQIYDYYLRSYIESEDIESLRESLNSVTIDEVLEINNKISLSTIYLLKGDN